MTASACRRIAAPTAHSVSSSSRCGRPTSSVDAWWSGSIGGLRSRWSSPIDPRDGGGPRPSPQESCMNCSRRVFLTTASGVVLSTRLAGASVQGANDRVRVAIIGTGGRARGLMNQLKPVAGVEIVGVCDVFEQRLLQAAEIAGPAAFKTDEYRRILDNKEIDAVLIGAPDHWHKTMTLDAVAAGKDVYVEKPVSHTIEEGAEMVKVIEASKQIVQTGTQQRSWEHYIEGKEIVQSGKLGQITFVQSYWYQHARPGQWPAAQPAGLDWKRWLGSA